MSKLDSRRAALKESFLKSSSMEFEGEVLLELLLSYAMPEDKLEDAARSLFDRFGTPVGILGAGTEVLLNAEGLSKSAAHLVGLAGSLIQRSGVGLTGHPLLSSPAKAGEYLVPRLMGLEREMMYALCLDAHLRLLSCRPICEGDLSRLSVDAYALITEVMEMDADALIIAHNHPSGIALPSREDRVTTRDLAKLLTDFGIVLLDHLVVAGSDFVSLASEKAFTALPSPLHALYLGEQQ